VSGYDYALIRLDRKVSDREPAPLNWSDPLTANTPAYVIGHPTGIPQELATGTVLATNADFVIHDADVFGGNSGGGLFDATGRLIGIHVFSSAHRFVPGPTGDCNVVGVCTEEVCDRKPHAYAPSALAALLTPELRAEPDSNQEP
jgi:hypothetical protein